MWGRRSIYLNMDDPIPQGALGNERKRESQLEKVFASTALTGGLAGCELHYSATPSLPWRWNLWKWLQTNPSPCKLLLSGLWPQRWKRLTNLPPKKQQFCLLNQIMMALCIFQITFYKRGLLLNLFLSIYLSLSLSLIQWPIWSLLKWDRKGNHSRLIFVVRYVFIKSWGQHLDEIGWF